MGKQHIMVIRTSKRRENVDLFQKVLTIYGCIIRVRLGLHDTENTCSDEGLFVLQLSDDTGKIKEFEKALETIDGIKFKLVEL